MKDLLTTQLLFAKNNRKNPLASWSAPTITGFDPVDNDQDQGEGGSSEDFEVFISNLGSNSPSPKSSTRRLKDSDKGKDTPSPKFKHQKTPQGQKSPDQSPLLSLPPPFSLNSPFSKNPPLFPFPPPSLSLSQPLTPPIPPLSQSKPFPSSTPPLHFPQPFPSSTPPLPFPQSFPSPPPPLSTFQSAPPPSPSHPFPSSSLKDLLNSPPITSPSPSQGPKPFTIPHYNLMVESQKIPMGVPWQVYLEWMSEEQQTKVLMLLFFFSQLNLAT